MGFPCILPAPAREKARGRYFSHGGSQNVPGPAAAGKHRVANLEDIAYTGFVHEKQNDNVIKGGKTSGRSWAKYRPIYEVSHRARSLRAACLLFIKGKVRSRFVLLRALEGIAERRAVLMGHALFCIARKAVFHRVGHRERLLSRARFSFCPVFLPRIETNRRNSL